ncbi:Planctomycete cytochrome C [Rubripirellula tenax]|uniref:Planctomycete cytochrome C n=2 Tax=Rubripirellula tenax TaxID=2528015 RepID=A0A5C6ESG8_9BACT|nr:Planctomycete cytochrome C [Rubripirellula tenax]
MFPTLCWLAFVTVFVPVSNIGAEQPRTFESFAKPFLHHYCVDCHSSDTQEGNVALDGLVGVDVDNSALWKTIWEQVALKAMPPEGEEKPTLVERWELSTWITDQLQTAMQDRGGFHAHLKPDKGNHLDHGLLFGRIPEGLDPPSSPARLWRLHPQEHLTRLNGLINAEPAYDPKRPGLRTRGDHINPNEDGEVKVYYGLDRVIGWIGGTAAYAAAITGFPPVLTSENYHGLRSYADLYSVNGAEATQIANNAENILRFMAYGPDAEPYQFADDVREIDQKYKHGDLRGLAQSLFYGKSTKRPLTPVYDLMAEDGVTDERLVAAVDFLFESLTGRPPTKAETRQYLALVKDAIADLGKQEGVILGLAPIFLDRDALFRPELVEHGEPDEFGRIMLSGQELALAINAALSYIEPDEALKQAVATGRLKTREDVRREVDRMLTDDSFRKPRVLQFFREFFDYDRAGYVCKDTKAMLAAGADVKPQTHYRTMFNMTAHTDRLVELILNEDKDVLHELLTTDRVVFDPNQDAPYFGEFVSSDPPPKDPDKKNAKKASRRVTIDPAELPKGEPIHVRVAQVIKSAKTVRALTSLPVEQRRGILTHPSWLVSHTDAMDNHAIMRGRWVRERLLGDAVPDVPITVDAMLPAEPGQTLRHRMRVTREEYCWKCHQKMDPLGLPFEMYNHLGLYRTKEQDQPVDTRGEIIGSGDPDLDGPVDDALDMIDKLARSERVKQVFVRHAFRFWIGRNETINDAPVLQEAYRAYADNGGSMKSLIASLVTSDAYLFRKVETLRGQDRSATGSRTNR